MSSVAQTYRPTPPRTSKATVIAQVLTIAVVLPVYCAASVVRDDATFIIFILSTVPSLLLLYMLLRRLHDDGMPTSFLLAQYLRGAVPYYILSKVLYAVLLPTTILSQVALTLLTVFIVVNSATVVLQAFPELEAYVDGFVEFMHSIQPDLSDFIWPASNATQIWPNLRPSNKFRMELTLRALNVLIFTTPGVLSLEICKWLIFRHYVGIVLRNYSPNIRLGCRGIVASACVGALGLVTQDMMYWRIAELFPTEGQSITYVEGVTFLSMNFLDIVVALSSQVYVALAEADMVVFGRESKANRALFVSFVFNWVFQALATVQASDIPEDTFGQGVLTIRCSLVVLFCSICWRKFKNALAREEVMLAVIQAELDDGKTEKRD